MLALFKTKGAQKGDKLRGVWIADDVGDVVPTNTQIDEATLTLEGDTDSGEFSLSKPAKGWPAGKYHVDIYANAKVGHDGEVQLRGRRKKDGQRVSRIGR